MRLPYVTVRLSTGGKLECYDIMVVEMVNRHYVPDEN